MYARGLNLIDRRHARISIPLGHQAVQQKDEHLVASFAVEGPPRPCGARRHGLYLGNAQWATLEQHLEYEWTNQRKCLASDEFKEGVAAFRAKREPDYRQF